MSVHAKRRRCARFRRLVYVALVERKIEGERAKAAQRTKTKTIVENHLSTPE